jgi:hypothetical protein
MTSTVNGRTCSSVKVAMPRYGNWTGWATLATDGALPETPGGVTLAVAGLSLVGTVKRQGVKNGLRSVELEGGFGGWSRAVSTRGGGLTLGNLVSLSAYAEKLAEAAGERVALAAGVDRKLGETTARLGALDAGALLSQACAAPAGSPVVPWWVDLDGTTRLGARTGASVTARAVDADDLGRAYVYAEDDATGLLPGATIDGGVIVELVIEAGERVAETATVAIGGEEAETVWGLLRRFVLRVIGPHVSARTLYRYVVRQVYADGRIRAVPVRSFLAPELDQIRVWPGIAGGRCKPKVGSEVLVQFADGDPVASAACIVGFSPAVVGSLSIPDRAELDGDEVVLARGTLPVARGGATFQIPSTSPDVPKATLTINITNPDGSTGSLIIAASNSGGPVMFTVAHGANVSSTGTIVIDPGRPEVLV